MTTIDGLTLHQPWAQLCVPPPGETRAVKRWETRAMPFGGLTGEGAPKVKPLPGAAGPVETSWCAECGWVAC